MPSAATFLPPTLLALLLAVPAAAVAQSEEVAEVTAADAVSVLRRGNRLFREGRLEEAYDTYRAGWDATEPHPMLLYNLATTAHHLGRLPEAILWYRRAEAVRPGDPWVKENLEQARASLGLTPYAPPGLATRVERHRTVLYLLAALLGWTGLALWIVRPRSAARPAMALGIGALVLYAAVAVAAAVAAAPAVLLEDCSDVGADLPAGSELWFVTGTDGTPEALLGGARVSCPESAVAPVDPADRG